MPRKKNRTTVWVIMHYEIFGAEPPIVDCVQFHVASSRRKAEAFLRASHVSPYSWWQVHPHALDCPKDEWLDEGEEVYFYNHRGRALRSAPWNQATKAWQRAKPGERPGGESGMGSTRVRI